MSAFPPLATLQAHGLIIFAFDFGRYLVAASVVTLVVWLMRPRWPGRKIQGREAGAADRRREFLQSVQTVMVYTLVSAFIDWGIKAGVLHRMNGGVSLPWLLALLVAMIVAHDTYFYWVHRAMHHPRLFRLFHRAHHRSVTPTPWAAYSFAVPEAFVMIAFVPLWLFFVPTPWQVTLSWLLFQIGRNAMGHAGYEMHPRWWLRSPLTRWITTTTHHDLHHSGGFNRNFGLYFTWWDRMMGTEHAHYAATFEQVVSRDAMAPQPVNRSASPIPAG